MTQFATAFIYLHIIIIIIIIIIIQNDTKNRELLKNPTKIEETQQKKIIDRN